MQRIRGVSGLQPSRLHLHLPCPARHAGLAATVALAWIGSVACADSPGTTEPPDAVSRVAISAEGPTALLLGETVKLRAVPLDAGNRVLVNHRIEWSSADASVASVDSTGLVTSTDTGSVIIRARAGARADSVRVSVAPQPLTVVVTAICAGGALRGFVWTPQRGFEDIGHLGGHATVARAVNDRGQVTGTSHDGAGVERAFIWTRQSGMRALPSPNGRWSRASDINNRGEVAGYYDLGDDRTRAVRWTAAGEVSELGDLGGGWSFAGGINASGATVGMSGTSGGTGRAFVSAPTGPMSDLGTLGGDSRANAIDVTGRVAGFYLTSTGVERAFLWSAAGGMTALGTFGGDTSIAYDVSAAGVVGHSTNARGEERAFIVRTGQTEMREVGTFPGSTFSHARGINDAGFVVGSSIQGGREVALLWRGEGAPEPLGAPAGCTWSKGFGVNNSTR